MEVTNNVDDERDPGDTSILAADGTRWIYSPEFDIWNGFQPGEPGLWEMSPEEMQKDYPEVVGAQKAQT